MYIQLTCPASSINCHLHFLWTDTLKFMFTFSMCSRFDVHPYFYFYFSNNIRLCFLALLHVSFTCRFFLTTPTFSVCAHVTAIAAHMGLLCNELATGVHTNLINLSVMHSALHSNGGVPHAGKSAVLFKGKNIISRQNIKH